MVYLEMVYMRYDGYYHTDENMFQYQKIHKLIL